MPWSFSCRRRIALRRFFSYQTNSKARCAAPVTDLCTPYRAPQHPASHVLHSIPPRAPSRSSRSNILSYTLHLATSSRLSSYSSPTGSRSLLYLAESERDQHDDVVCIDDAWFDAEQKTQGLWKLGANLLQSSRREGGLPPSVERRVDLAGLAEDLLLAPSADRAVAKIDTDSVQPSSDVHELVALKALTAPDPTTLYHTTSTTSTLATSSGNEGGSAQAPVHSVAQSLIDLKFGGKADPSDAVSPSFDDNKPLPHLLLDDPSSASSSSHAAPHMDYRIVAGQNMRTRARSIFSTSPLPALTASYCRSHRVPSCTVCASIVSTASERESNHATMRRKNVPGSGLRFVASTTLAQGGGAKKPLVALLPDFIKLSAALLSDVKERANRPMSTGDDAVDEALLASIVKTEEASPSFSTVPLPLDKGKSKEVEASASTVSVEMQVTAEWYDLLTHLLVQACLEGYLVDGWTGTEGVETLFGVGCGVWEGRGWSAKQPLPSSFSSAPLRERRERRRSPDDAGSSSDESSEDEDEQAEREAEELRRKKEDETRALVEAARALFGSRDVAQADYERTLRDKTHEVRLISLISFPESKTDSLSSISSSTSLKTRLFTSTSTPSASSTLSRGSKMPWSTGSKRA